jgi:hypothetical protein
MNCPVCKEEINGFDYYGNTSLEMDKDEELDEDFDENCLVHLHCTCEKEYVRKNNIFHCDICNTCGYKNNNKSICLYKHNKCVYKQLNKVDDETIIHKAYTICSDDDDDQPYHINTYHKKCMPYDICKICSDGFDENNYKDVIIDFYNITEKYHIECCEKINNLCSCEKALYIKCDDCHKNTNGCFNYNHHNLYSLKNQNDFGGVMIGDDVYCDSCI